VGASEWPRSLKQISITACVLAVFRCFSWDVRGRHALSRRLASINRMHDPIAVVAYRGPWGAIDRAEAGTNRLFAASPSSGDLKRQTNEWTTDFCLLKQPKAIRSRHGLRSPLGGRQLVLKTREAASSRPPIAGIRQMSSSFACFEAVESSSRPLRSFCSRTPRPARFAGICERRSAAVVCGFCHRREAF
jgi:hypothetical protein